MELAGRRDLSQPIEPWAGQVCGYAVGVKPLTCKFDFGPQRHHQIGYFVFEMWKGFVEVKDLCPGLDHRLVCDLRRKAVIDAMKSGASIHW